jgi:hypothetical protein
VANQDEYSRLLLTGVASGKPVSQRSLARDLGIALGLTNLLMRRLVRKGWIRIVRVKPNRVLYLITPAGIAEKARMSREYFQRSVAFYAETRDRIRQSFEHLTVGPDGARVERIVFFGAGEVAEVGFVCLAETGLTLVGVVDDERVKPFFGTPVYPSSELTASAIAGRPYDRVAVMSFGDPGVIRERLALLGIPESHIHWLEAPLEPLIRAPQPIDRAIEHAESQ